jgi:hypothetical protein
MNQFNNNLRLCLSDDNSSFLNQITEQFVYAKDLPDNAYLIDGDGSRGGLWFLYTIVKYPDGVYFTEVDEYFQTIKEAKEYIKSEGGKQVKHYNSSY